MEKDKPQTSKAQLYAKLDQLMTNEELQVFIDALERVMTVWGGFGRLGINIAHRRILKIEIASTMKPGVEDKMKQPFED